MTQLTPDPTITVDGVELNNYAYLITERTGWDNTPALVGENIKVPGRDGEIWREKSYGPGRVVLDLYVSGRDANGSVPAGFTEETKFRANLDKLFQLFTKRTGLIEVQKQYEDGVQRYNYAEVGAVISPKYVANTNTATMTVELVFPNPIWSTPISVTNSGTLTNGAQITLSNFAGSTAPISDALFLVTGPFTALTIFDNVSGKSISLSIQLTAGQKWRFDSGAFTSQTGTDLTILGTGTPTNALLFTTFTGPRFLELNPVPEANYAPRLDIAGAGFTAASTITVKGSRKWIA